MLFGFNHARPTWIEHRPRVHCFIMVYVANGNKNTLVIIYNPYEPLNTMKPRSF